MYPRLRSFVLPCLGVLGFTWSATASAQLAQNLLLGNAKALALGNAVTADPPGVDAIHFNPAGLSRLEGSQVNIKVITGSVDVQGEFTSNPAYPCPTTSKTQNCQPDPFANTKSDINALAIYVPGQGVTEIPVLVAPLGGLSYQPPDSTLTFATSVYAPLILGFTRDEDDPGKFYGEELGLTRITYFAPTMSWEYSDTLSMGFGVGFSYFGAGLKLDYRSPNGVTQGIGQLLGNDCALSGTSLLNQLRQDICGQFDPYGTIFRLEADVNESYSTTLNFGILWQATRWLSLGAVYQTEAADRLDGDITVEISEPLTNLLLGAGNTFGPNVINNLTGVTVQNQGRLEQTGYIDITIPQHFALGASVQVSPAWKFNVDWKWTQTSAWDDLTFYFDQPLRVLNLLTPLEGVEGNNLVIPRGYEDASNFAYGLEFQYTDQIAFRAGYEPRDSGIPDDKLDFLIPLGDFKLYGLGASYAPSAREVYDVAFGYAKSEQFIPAGSSTNGNDVRTDSFVYNPSSGLDVRTMLEAVLLEFSYQYQI